MKKMVIDEAFLSELEALQTLLKNNLAGALGGNRRSRNLGSSCEFADHRDYAPGDDVTKIDWNAYARFDKLYEKLYYDDEKAEQAIRIAAAFAYLSVAEMDKVSIYAMHSDRLEAVVEGMVGKDSYLNCIERLNAVEFDGDAKISEAIVPSQVGYGDGFSIIISDFLTDDNFEDAIDRLCLQKRDVLCVQILSREELNPQVRGRMHLFDSESGDKFFRKKIDHDVVRAYKDALKFVIDRIRNFCESRGAAYMMTAAHEPVTEIFFGKLSDLEVTK